MRASLSASVGLAVSAAATLSAAGPARAAKPLTGSVLIEWFTVTASGAGDFETYCCSDVRLDMVRTTLGPNGKPVLNPASVGPQNFTGVDPVTGELQWWSPGTTAGGDIVTATGTSIVSFPFSDFSLFPPNGGGSSNASGFQTLVLSGLIFTPKPILLTFSLAADDDAFLFVNSKLVTGIGGVHPHTAAPMGTVLVKPGTTPFNLFYADRHSTGASLDISATYAVVPEPGIWAMLIAGFGLVGFAARRTRPMHA
ncbi:PEPxxWA-CTERM sorting domain-containing protein [Thermaurantiacus tibetensis]|uniref:PEPxxWA-CTERM sorting domain-containing protein n=1 Tax=Thermaurantiacus tibetensis TaxID=2759035 RepID=UPI00188F6964|nr:PEPxxWA-CTERM sorting domain-containing protein [Thermaurantiacus tibetensis]